MATRSPSSSALSRGEDAARSVTVAESEILQRAIGVLRARVKCRDGRTVLDRFRQEGCLKARLPRPEVGAWTSIVTLNSAGAAWRRATGWRRPSAPRPPPG